MIITRQTAMIFFDKVTTTLKQKWLFYFQANRAWLTKTKDNWVTISEGGCRPSSELILGAINALEPRLSALMIPFCDLNSDPDRLVQVLGLDFDPDQELKLLAQQEAEQKAQQSSSEDSVSNNSSHHSSALLIVERSENTEKEQALIKLREFNKLKESQGLVKTRELDTTLQN